MKKIIALLVLCILLTNIFVTPCYATLIVTPEENDSIETSSTFYPIAYDQYSSVVWPSLSKAQKYYGTDYSYYQCNHTYQGTVYNFYYLLSDTSKMFFRVAVNFDGSPILSDSPEYETE